MRVEGSMTSIAALAFFLLPSALELSAPTGGDCPDVTKVRAALVDLGVDLEARSGAAAWSREDGHVRLRITRGTATSSAGITERDLEASGCDELAQIVALSIERATSPIGEIAVEAEPPIEPRPGLRFDVRAGLSLLRSSKTELGGVAAVELAMPWSGPFAALIAVEGWPPTTVPGSGFSLDVGRFGAAVGLSARAPLGSVLAIGASAALLLDYAHGAPRDRPIELDQTRDLREGFRGTASIVLLLGPIEARLEPGIRAMRGVLFHARPAQGDVTLPGVEAEIGLEVGWARNFF
jgi:hypothetical protein